MSTPHKARCPECGRRVAVLWHGRLVFVHHHPSRRSPVVCPGSGYIVEDEDLAS